MAKLKIAAVVEKNGKLEPNILAIERLVDTEVGKYCHDLDEVVKEVRDILQDEKDELSIDDLNYYIALLPTLMFFVGNSLENLGIKGDISETSKKEEFNRIYNNSKEKTVQGKTSEAENTTIEDTIIESIYRRAYKKCRLRLDHADLLLASLKKIHTWKITEFEKSGMGQQGTNFR